MQYAVLDQAADRARVEGQLDDFQGARARSIGRSGASGGSDWAAAQAAGHAGNGIETNGAWTKQSLSMVRNRLAPPAIGRKNLVAATAGRRLRRNRRMIDIASLVPTASVLGT